MEKEKLFPATSKVLLLIYYLISFFIMISYYLNMTFKI